MKYTGTELLKLLCEMYGPTGFEQDVAAFIKEQTEGLCEYLPDRMGNLICRVKGNGENLTKVMISAHMDEVGFIISDIEENGTVKFILDGGINPKVMAARGVVLFNEEHTVKGLISSKAIHGLSPEERKEALPADKMSIDIGADSADEVRQYVNIGDFGTFDSDFVIFGENDRMIKCKAIDDRLGCAAMIEVMRTITPGTLPVDLYFAFTTREEIGNSGAQVAAQVIQPDYAIVLESTAIADIAGVPENTRVSEVGKGGTISLMDNSTIYNREFVELALELAKKENINAQVKRYVSGGNDAGHIHKSGKGVKALAISAPTRYLHSACCVASLDDYDSIKTLVSALVNNLK